MRMVKMKPQQLTLDGAIQKFLLVKESQHTGEETMKDYQNCLSRFLQHSRNSLDEAQLENDVLTFFAAIPDTSPASPRQLKRCSNFCPHSTKAPIRDCGTMLSAW